MAVVVAAFLPVEMALSAGDCTVSAAETAQDDQETAFLVLLNEYRGTHGLPALVLSPGLTRAATWDARDLATHAYFSHTSSDGRNFLQRAQDCGYQGVSAEIIAGGTVSAQSVLMAWEGSPGHNAALLGRYGPTGAVGIGRVFGGGYGVIWTVDFGVVQDSPPPPPPRVLYFAPMVARD